MEICASIDDRNVRLGSTPGCFCAFRKWYNPPDLIAKRQSFEFYTVHVAVRVRGYEQHRNGKHRLLGMSVKCEVIAINEFRLRDPSVRIRPVNITGLLKSTFMRWWGKGCLGRER